MIKIHPAGLALAMTLAVAGSVVAFGPARAADASAKTEKTSAKTPENCKAHDAPYRKYGCLDAYLGNSVFERLINYYRLEWGHDVAPTDPKAPASRRAGWPNAPLTSPPMPFTEWPYGGSTALGVTRPGSVDSPLMAALSSTSFGKWLNDAHIQIYGWVDVGANISTNSVKPGGNWPAPDDFTPNTVQLDQTVINIERLPDTVQTDHVDWGFHFSALYGETYRYTTAYGLFSSQLLNHDRYYGYDLPQVYGEVYLPQFAQGLLLRFGRYVAIPDIEAQLAPYNYMYSHSMAYVFDNVTNTGVLATLALTKNWFVQAGLTVGTDTMPWNLGQVVANPFPNPVFPNATMPKDPGAQPSFTGGVRWQSDSGRDSVYLVANGINNGTWGYDNQQWYGMTWYHRFDERWHLSFETYTASQRNVLNITDPLGIVTNGGYPLSAQLIPFNTPNLAHCSDPAAVTCTAQVYAAVAYLNYRLTALDNISLRPEFYDDMEGQRTGTKTRYVDFGIGWQHWFSPQIEIRPEVTYYRSLDAPAFNGNFNATPAIAPNRNYALIGAMDLICHF